MKNLFFSLFLTGCVTIQPLATEWRSRIAVCQILVSMNGNAVCNEDFTHCEYVAKHCSRYEVYSRYPTVEEFKKQIFTPKTKKVKE